MDEREWALVRAGRTFYMGSPNNERGRYSQEVRHPVVLTRNYWIMRTEITQSQFGQMMGYNPSHERNCSNCPVEQVRWSELAAYANARSANAGLQACYECFGSGHTGVDCIPSRRYASPYACPGFRLPTEAEWEYAARAGDTRATYNGALDVLTCDPSATLNGIAWYCGNSGSRAHPVGQKRANAWGLSDMLGNVQEWCHDWLGDYPSPSRTATNPTGPNNGQERVLRGGSWGRIPRRTRAAYRYSHEPDDAYNQAGGRLVRTVP
jgi:formylglycine-generating enzyme required for sulfatase activity